MGLSSATISSMRRSAESRLRELGTARYWRHRQNVAKRTQALLQSGSLLRGQAAKARDGLRAGWRLALGSAKLVILALAAIAALELVACATRFFLPDLDISLVNSPDGRSGEAVVSLVESAVAVGATLLGLYYATVGVIASTIYKSVRGDVRDLFISERNSEAYLRIVLLTVASGITVLVASALGYAVSSLTLLALAVFATLTCVGLVGVTKRLLAYFDPSQLALPLFRTLGAAIFDAGSEKTRGIPHRQDEAQTAAIRSLASYRHLIELIEGTELRNANAPVSLTRQLLRTLELYSSWKHAIPTDSRWWQRVPQHMNWLTADHTRLHLALRTSSGFPPDMQPDYLWFEHALARLLKRTLTVAFLSQGGADALSVAEDVANLVYRLTARSQIEEALVIETMWGLVVAAVTDTPQVAASDAADYELRINQMVAAESLVRPLTSMVLGLSHGATALATRDLDGEFEAALQSPKDLYNGTLPTETRKMLEGFAMAVRRENDIEGHRITPSWWVNHLAARSMVDALIATENGILRALASRTIDRVTAFQAGERPDLAAVAGMASLELLHKLEVHQQQVSRTLEALEKYRNGNTSIPGWPTRSPGSVSLRDEHQNLLRRLAELLPALRRTAFDPREPDLYGQVYQFVIEGAFTAILEGDRDRGLLLYEAALSEVDSARSRISTDLASVPDRTRLTFALEPVITAMDLAGYALLLQELDGSGIWAEVRTLWESRLQGNPALSQFLLAAAAHADDVLPVSPGSFERSRRSSLLEHMLEERELHQAETHVWPPSANRGRPHPSPIVSAFVPRRYRMTGDLYALFVAEFLASHLPHDADLPSKVRRLAEAIKRFRNLPDPVVEDGDSDV